MDPSDERVSRSSSHSSRPDWMVCGYKFPRSEVVFFCQTVILYIVILVSLYNLTCGHENSTLWTALLSGSLGIISPPPDITTKLRVKRSDANTLHPV